MYGRGNYIPPVEAVYWSMRVMAYAGSLIALVAVLGAFLYWKRKLEKYRWFLWAGVLTSFLPFVATSAGWILTEVGRQPWIVQGLLKTRNANSPSVSSTWIGISLAVFVTLYLILGVVDVWLMRRFAGRDPGPDPAASPTAAPEPQPAVGY
jgi:cytochrome bd ubiquinol oxidase subunit I